jgi:hypothetical protein
MKKNEDDLKKINKIKTTSKKIKLRRPQIRLELRRTKKNNQI